MAGRGDEALLRADVPAIHVFRNARDKRSRANAELSDFESRQLRRNNAKNWKLCAAGE
jgi:hypothetical protein